MKTYIVGNWKMHFTIGEASIYLHKLLKKISIILPKKMKNNYLNKLINVFGSSDFKNLNPNSSYRIVKVSFAKGGSSSVVTRSVNFNSYPPFTPTEGCVTNLGVAQYTWQDDKIYTKYYSNTIVHARFEELAAESEWLSKPIVDIYNY